jgi:hypothetical protein
MTLVIAYLALGAVVGVVAGLLGVGGGLIIVPALLYLFHIQGISPAVAMHLAIGSSLATIVFTSISSAWAHHRHGAVRWSIVFYMTPGIAVGAVLGAVIAKYLAGPALRQCFAVFEWLVAIQMWFGLRPSPARRLPGTAPMGLTGGFIGAISSILGIGGGTLTVPFLVWCNVSLREAVATSAACGLPIAIAGALGFAATGWNNPDLPALSSGFVYWPAVAGVVATSILTTSLGAWLTHRLPVLVLRRIFAVVLALIGWRMFL